MRVIACPHCGMKYRIDPAKFQQKELRIRCKTCEGSFGVDITDPDAQPYGIGDAPKPDGAAPSPSASTPPQPPGPSSPPVGAAPKETKTGGQKALLGHSQEDVQTEVKSLLENAGFSVHVVNNGVDALMHIEQHKPDIAVLDVSLPKMFGFEVCEVVRRDQELDHVKLLLIAAIYDKSRYKRSPTTLYGADDYIEKHSIPEELVDKCLQLVGRAGESSTDTEQPPSAAATETPAAPAPPTDIDEADLERARRLARTIISDISLYNKEKIESGIRAGNTKTALEAEIAEGIELFNSRIDQHIQDAEPFLENALDAFIETKKQELGVS